MTDMKRITISFTDDMAEAIEKVRGTNEFKRASYSEIVRRLVLLGLSHSKDEGVHG